MSRNSFSLIFSWGRSMRCAGNFFGVLISTARRFHDSSFYKAVFSTPVMIKNAWIIFRLLSPLGLFCTKASHVRYMNNFRELVPKFYIYSTTVIEPLVKYSQKVREKFDICSSDNESSSVNMRHKNFFLTQRGLATVKKHDNWLNRMPSTLRMFHRVIFNSLFSILFSSQHNPNAN